MIFGEENWNVQLVLRRALFSAEEYTKFINKRAITDVDGILIVRWLPPPVGVIKLNVDGSCFAKTSITGSGGLMRTDTGNWVSGFSSFDSQGDALYVELSAIKNGLTFVWSKGHRKIHCETDSLEVVNLVQEGFVIVSTGMVPFLVRLGSS